MDSDLATADRLPPLEGHFRVRRVSGLLPPRVSKVLEGHQGVTRWFGIPVGRFRIDGAQLVYRRWPVRDALHPGGDGRWLGEGRLFGVRFCRFLLEPSPPVRPRRQFWSRISRPRERSVA